ncbi:MAG: alcohol dehydrogenase catalytic domain-containing protein [Edaphobacter sp.]|uniref:zinc-dependent alcohol dehydrogenase n=1 Tax=Edaphobacter sp. TaxID=1934404 RepID=UPI00239BF56F|nr:alcohol dehydrogenase catalytic domain-containing protein [Edaphobacter sp.]MDE1175588.1 alcohol dehydrogenase catalytic domain-containing protein [Edaphobacter sp.]
MRQLIWHGNEDVRLQKNPSGPNQPGEGEVLIGIKAVGICGTDIHIMKGALPGAYPPMVLGHEIAGQIATVGKNVNRVQVGDRVTVDSVVGCGKCELCKQSRSQFCPNGYELGINRDGACQDYLIVPERNVYRIPDSISFEEAAVLDIEVWNSVRKCGIQPKDRVLILGAGPIGMIASQLTRILGAGHITLSDSIQDRLRIARDLKLADAYESAPLNDASTDYSSVPYDVILDCAGTSASTQYALRAVRPCGRVLLYGVHEEAIDSLDINQIVLKDLVVYGALCDRNGWEDVVELAASGALDLKSLITHRFPIENGAQAYDAVRNRSQGLIKAVLLL